MESSIGSGGTFVAAALESVGYYYQSWILDNLSAPLTTSVGALIYIIAAIVAVITVILTGDFKVKRWFLIGPCLFFSAISIRTEVGYASWKFGSQSRSDTLVEAYVKKSLEGRDFGAAAGGTTANVSGVFAFYNNMISNVVQEVVRVVIGRKKNIDLKFMNQLEFLVDLQGVRVNDSGLRELINLAFLDRCREPYELASKAQGYKEDNRYMADQRGEFRTQYEKMLGHRRVSLSYGAKEYLKRLSSDYPGLWDKKYAEFSGGSADPQMGIEKMKGDLPSYAEKNNELSQSATPSAASGKVEDTYSCLDIWNFVYTGIYLTAKTSVDSAIIKAQNMNIPGEEVVQSLSKLLVQKYQDSNAEQFAIDAEATGENIKENPFVLYSAIAKYVLKNSILDANDNATFINRFMDRSREYSTLSIPGDSLGMNDDLERHRQKQNEWRFRNKLIAQAQQIPYYQGLVLYFLAITYPFFALLLLFPGKQSGFLKWFLLWFWAKSWDIGYAIVMLLDSFLFNMMAIGRTPGSDEMPVGLSADLATALYSLRELDPTFNITTYYSIIGVALTSVPVMASYFIMGGLHFSGELISAGISEFGSEFSSFQDTAAIQPVTQYSKSETVNSAIGGFQQGLEQGLSGPSGPKISMPGHQKTLFESRLPENMPQELQGVLPGDINVAAPLDSYKSRLMWGAGLTGFSRGLASGPMTTLKGLPGASNLLQLGSELDKDYIENKGRLVQGAGIVGNGAKSVATTVSAYANIKQNVAQNQIAMTSANAHVTAYYSDNIGAKYQADTAESGALPLPWQNSEIGIGAKEQFNYNKLVYIDNPYAKVQGWLKGAKDAVPLVLPKKPD